MTDSRFSEEKHSNEIAPRQKAALQHSSGGGTYSGTPSSTGLEEVHLRVLWRIVCKRKWLIVGVAFVITTLVTIEAYRTKPAYRGSAMIEIGRDNAAVRSNNVIIQSDESLAVKINTSEVILKSAPLLNTFGYGMVQGAILRIP